MKKINPEDAVALLVCIQECSRLSTVCSVCINHGIDDVSFNIGDNSTNRALLEDACAKVVAAIGTLYGKKILDPSIVSQILNKEKAEQLKQKTTRPNLTLVKTENGEN